MISKNRIEQQCCPLYLQESSMISTPQPPSTKCPYLSTIKKHLIDFDFEKVCSLTLAHTNIYCCLVCGRYFQGRSSSSPAYQHSIQYSHYVFMNLQNGKIFCLPDGYEVQSHTLSDIVFNLRPHYDSTKLKELQRMEDCEYNIDGKEFFPGVVGINNLGKTDYATSVFYLFNAIKEIRTYFLTNNDFEDELVSQFSLLLKKIWNPLNFKGIVSPHEFLQYISDRSGKKFKIGSQSDPTTFMLWMMDALTKGIKKQYKKKYFDVSSLVRGSLKTSVIRVGKESNEYEDMPSKVQETPFLILKLQFPEKGIFNKRQNEVELSYLMEEYLGKRGQKNPQGLRFAKIINFPEYLVLVFKRFSDNGYQIEKDTSHLLYGEHLDLQQHKYELIGQICHEGDYETGKYKGYCCISGRWFEVEDLLVRKLVDNQILLVQPYVQIYKRQQKDAPVTL